MVRPLDPQYLLGPLFLNLHRKYRNKRLNPLNRHSQGRLFFVQITRYDPIVLVTRIEDVALMRTILVGLLGIVLLGPAGWGAYRIWPRILTIRTGPLLPVWEQTGDRSVVTLPSRFLVAYVARYDDEFYAYLMFTYLRGSRAFQDSELLLTFRKSPSAVVYEIQVRLKNDLLSSIDLLAQATASGLISSYDWRFVHPDTFRTFQYQTHLLDVAYNLPVERKLENLSRSELEDYIRRFVTFKSVTDRRVQASLDLAPKPLSAPEASRLAADIVAVSNFYSLPLDFFLGIGAMENNYMNVKGDLGHAVWKRHAGQGDVVLKRQKGKVLVLNQSSGVWQITRETLRYAHKLYLKDTRDYSRLPAALRPPIDLNPDDVDPEVLTTYAGLLFRDLLDRFHGDVASAVGAYNGGPGNPNPRYEAGVRMVADYARHVMEHAAALNGRPVAGTNLVVSEN